MIPEQSKPHTLSDHALVPKVRLEVLLGDVLGALGELDKRVDAGLALRLTRLGLLHDPEWCIHIVEG